MLLFLRPRIPHHGAGIDHDAVAAFLVGDGAFVVGAAFANPAADEDPGGHDDEDDGGGDEGFDEHGLGSV